VPVYQVMVRAQGLRGTFDGKEISCGFFKNEFVWARDRSQAIVKAKARVASSLLRQSMIKQDGLAALSLEIEDVADNLPLYSLLRKQGFVFHPLDEKR
jgi:hypothetical protein